MYATVLLLHSTVDSFQSYSLKTKWQWYMRNAGIIILICSFVPVYNYGHRVCALHLCRVWFKEITLLREQTCLGIFSNRHHVRVCLGSKQHLYTSNHSDIAICPAGMIARHTCVGRPTDDQGSRCFGMNVGAISRWQNIQHHLKNWILKFC